MAARLLPSLLSCLGHPYKVCREQIAWMLFLAFGFGRLPLAGPATGGVDVVAHVRAVAMAEPSDPEVSKILQNQSSRVSCGQLFHRN